MKRLAIFTVAVAMSSTAYCVGAPYDIGKDIATECFWKSDPNLFVQSHGAQGFRVTSEVRGGVGKRPEGADTRLDGAVTYNGIPVYETKVYFGASGGIERVELMLFAAAGTEALETVRAHDGDTLRRYVRKEKTITRDEYMELLKRVCAVLTPAEGTSPQIAEKLGVVQGSHTWPETAIPTVATLTWNYSQKERKANAFKAGFLRLAVDGPARLVSGGRKAAGGASETKGSKKTIAGNVIRDSNGDVFIDSVPMVDQGQKGYCAAATSERVLRYYGVEVDEHEIAQAAGTTADGGTSTLEMKNSVQKIGRHYKLGTVVTYGDFEKSEAERCTGLAKEVANYNKAAKKLRKREIGPDVYISKRGGVTYYDAVAADAAMEPEVLREMKVNGSQKSKFTKFMKDIRQQVEKGIPLFWGVTLGTYQESDIPQSKGGHMRLIIGYNDKTKEVLYSDSWGKGHELKRMPAEWAWTISHCLMYMKPLR